MSRYYRFLSGSVGIYEAVQKDCPKEDPRRENKPDGSWLTKKGTDYPGAISFWSEIGLKKYISSGLLAWHTSVVKEEVKILIIEKPSTILYEDQYQIICNPKQIKIKQTLALKEFNKQFKIKE